jgi:uncharacterized protein (DUF924 family)
MTCTFAMLADHQDEFADLANSHREIEAQLKRMPDSKNYICRKTSDEAVLVYLN